MTSSAPAVHERPGCGLETELKRRGAAKCVSAGPRCFERGFTLVEMLIALSILAIIMVLVFSGLRLGSRAWEGVETVTERTAELRLARNFLERVLRQARPTYVIFDGEQRPVFGGDGGGFEIAAPLSDQVGIPGMYVLRIYAEDLRDSRRLVLERWLLHQEILEGEHDVPEWKPMDSSSGVGGIDGPLDQDLASGAWGRSVLVEDLDELEISYFGAPEGEVEPDWQDEWLEQPNPPLLLRLHMNTKRQTWPDLVVAMPQPET